MYQYFIHLYGWIIFHCMNILHLVYLLLADGQLGWFHCFTILNSTAINVHVQVFVQDAGLIPGLTQWVKDLALLWAVFNSLSICLLESPCYMILCLSVWGARKFLFYSEYTILLPHQQYGRMPVSSLLHQHLLLSAFLIIGISVGMKFHRGFYLHLSNDFEYLFL